MIFSVFSKIFIKEFYKENAFFFLVTTGLAFGFMGGAEHKALAEFFISSNILVLFPVVLWLFYTIKVIHFNTQSVYRPTNIFLHQSIHLRPSSLFSSLLLTLLVQLAPIILYATFLILTSIKDDYFATTPTIIFSILILLVISIVKLHHDLKNPGKEIQPTRIKVWLDKKINRTFPLMTIEWIIRNNFLIWIGSKFLSLTLLFGTIELYKTDTYDYRLLTMGCTIAFTANIVLLIHVHHFENKIFTIYKNMPISFYKRGLFILIVLIVLCLPEIGLLVSRLPSVSLSYLLILPYSISILIALYGFLFISDWGSDKAVRIIFFFTIVLIVLTIFKVPILLLTSGLTVIGLSQWKIRYYKFERL